MNRQDYLDNLETFVHEPESVGLSEAVIPVAMWLRGYIPGDDPMSAANKSSQMIRLLMADVVDVPLNEIARLMVLNGYALTAGGANPEWMMQRIEDDVDSGA